MTLRGHFDGEKVILDEPVPADLAPNTPVEILYAASDARGVLDEIAKLAVDTDELPPDFAEQHDHYTRGTPRR